MERAVVGQFWDALAERLKQPTGRERKADYYNLAFIWK